MKYTPGILREVLRSLIRKLEETPEQFVRRPGRDFTRPRTLSFETVISLLLTMSENSIGKALIRRFKNREGTPSASALVQQREELLPAAMETLFQRFTACLRPTGRFQGYRLLAADGSDLKSAAYPGTPASYWPGTARQHGWNLWHLNALYDLQNGIYTDVIVQKEREKDRKAALCVMVDRSSVSGSVILLADRGYEACNNLAHLERKGWNYLIRLRDKNRAVAYGLKLPDTAQFDIPVQITLGRQTARQLEQLSLVVPASYYHVPPQMTFDDLEPKSTGFATLSFRIVRIETENGNTELLITNLEPKQFPPTALKRLYTMRWEIESSFRNLKYAVGLIHLHTKKLDLVLQEIFACFFILNFTQASIWTVDTAKNTFKYQCRVNFSDAVFACCVFLREAISNPLPLLQRKLLPIRPGRTVPRPPKITGNRISSCYTSTR